jgi:HEAT repeat protein
MEAAKSSDHDLAISAVNALGEIKSKPEVVLPFLLGLLNDASREDIRAVVAPSICCFRGEAKYAVPELLKALKCEGIKDRERCNAIRSGVLYGFRFMGPDAKDAIPDLLELFLDKAQDSTIRQMAIHALAKIAPGSKAAVSPLIEVLPKREFSSYTEDIAEALAAVGEPSVEPLVKLLASAPRGQPGSMELYVRRMTIRALGKIGPKAAPALPLLRGALQDEDRFVSSEAKTAIEQIERK